MKYFFSIIISLLFSYYGIAQTPITGKVIDSSTQLPIPKVEISTSDSNKTFTNSEGKFYLNYTGGSVKFQNVYYQEKEIPDIKDNSVISLIPLKTNDIDEIVIGDTQSKIKNIYKKRNEKYALFPFSESFFLRSTLQKNHELIRMTDITGSINRNTLFLTKDIKNYKYKLNISNVRRAGKISKSNDTEYFKLFSFYELLMQGLSAFVPIEEYYFYKNEIINAHYSKIYFTAKENIKNPAQGYYVINDQDSTIISVNYKITQDDNPFEKKQGFKWRTLERDISINFSYDSQLKKYTNSNCTLNYKVELYNKENIRNEYNINYSFILYNPRISDISSNASIDKEIFNISVPYNEEFWKNQNQLLLTQEMKDFINSLHNNKEYKIILNK